MEIHLTPPLPSHNNLLLHTLWLHQSIKEAFIPATLSPSIILFVRGGGQLVHDDGRREIAPRFFLRGPYTRPVQVEYVSDTVAMSVCFIPGMLNKSCEIDLPALLNSVVPMEEIFDKTMVTDFLNKLDIQDNQKKNIDDFHHFLSIVLKENKRNFISDAFMAAHQKMFSPLLDLTAHFGIGERQLERRVKTTFGLNLRELRRLVRFGFTLQRIINEGAAWGDLTRVALDSGYYDQAHMHKEFSDLAGISPANLLQRIAAKDPAYWLYQLSSSDFKNLFIAVK